MSNLFEKLKPFIEKSPSKQSLSDEAIAKMDFVYPFTKEEYAMALLLADGTMTKEDYAKLREEYIAGSQNLRLFEMAPRAFSEKWGQSHLQSIAPELLAPSKELDPSYSGDYDLFYQGVKIEVKASRATDHDREENTPEAKALAYGSKKKFGMNFQQIKCSCCDVFVWMGVWRDKIVYWVIKSADVLSNPHYSQSQHRGNVGEGQLWLTDRNISEFDKYRVEPKDLLARIIERYCSDPERR